MMSNLNLMWISFCEQQEEEKRRQKIEIWESMQLGKSYKGAAKAAQVSLTMYKFVFLTLTFTLKLSSLLWTYFKIQRWNVIFFTKILCK